MVADDEIHALAFGIVHFLYGFDATVQGDDQRRTLACGVVDALGRDTVTFGITIRDVEQQVLVTYLAQKFINQRDGGRAIDVVVAVHHDLLTVADGPLHPFDRLVHIRQGERIESKERVRVEEIFYLFVVAKSAYNGKQRGDRIEAVFLGYLSREILVI